MIEPEGFIKEYKDFILEHIPTNVDWAESIATSLLSTVMGASRTIMSVIGPLKLNVWFLMIGPSGLAFKSAPLNYFVFPTLVEVSNIIKKKTIVPSRYSVEGMIEYLSKESNWGSIVRDEFTGLFKETSKSYLSDMLEFMSELYDGTLQKRFTRKAKLEEAIDVYITFLSSTTPYLFKIMKPDFFVQGTGCRLLFVYLERPSVKFDYSSEEFFYQYHRQIEREERLRSFAKALATLNTADFRYFSPEKEAGDLWLEFRRECLEESMKRYERDAHDPVHIYIGRSPEMALKLSALHCVSKSYQTLPMSELSEVIITKNDVEWAIDKTKRHIKFFHDLIEAWRKKPLPIEARTLEEQIGLVVEMLEQAGSEGMAWSKMRADIQWESRVWCEVIKFLWETKSICIFDDNGSTLIVDAKSVKENRGRPLQNWAEIKYRLKLI